MFGQPALTIQLPPITTSPVKCSAELTYTATIPSALEDVLKQDPTSGDLTFSGFTLPTNLGEYKIAIQAFTKAGEELEDATYSWDFELKEKKKSVPQELISSFGAFTNAAVQAGGAAATGTVGQIRGPTGKLSFGPVVPKPAPTVVKGTNVKAGGTTSSGTASGSTTFEAAPAKGGEVKINVDNTVAGGDGGSGVVKGEKPQAEGKVSFEAGGDATVAEGSAGADTFDIDAEADTGFEANGFGAETDVTVDASFSI